MNIKGKEFSVWGKEVGGKWFLFVESKLLGTVSIAYLKL
jgi:hypothetical protein